jgi:hypothetical protein
MRNRPGSCLSSRSVAWGAAALFVILTGLHAAHAADLLLPATEADVQAASGKGPDLGQLAAKTRLVRLDRAALGRHVAPLGMDDEPGRLERARSLDGVIAIELFPGVKATFHRTDVDTIGSSGYAWTGRSAGSRQGVASLIIDDGQVTGDIRLGRRLFRIAPVSGIVHRVSEIDATRFPPD